MRQDIPIKQIRVSDPFWDQRIGNAVENVIPYQWRVLNDQEPGAEPSHAIQNFRIAAGLAQGEFYGRQFQDSDLAKWMEAAAFSLVYRDDPTLHGQLEDMIALLEQAQEADGYMDTHFILTKPDRKWLELAHGHELYCAGHMLEAAVAYLEVTGSDRFLRLMERLVDLIRATFGKEPGKIDSYPGHEEIELALMKAYRATGDEKYLNLAEYFLLNRGTVEGFKAEDRYKELEKQHRWLDASYYQAHQDVLSQETAEGHAVRAMYLYTGMADVALATGSEELTRALNTLWENVTRRRMYVTGGVGSQGDGERFTIDYDLPNDTCYTETCAAIGLAMWSLRMLRLSPRAEYADVMERALYNGVLSGISLDGDRYFYVNPLMVKPDVAHYRQDHESVETSRVKWFGCACCPPNVIRTLTGLGGYVYTRQDNRIYQHLYVGNTAELDLEGGKATLRCESQMPWTGSAAITIATGTPFELALRVPGYASDFTISVNGKTVDAPRENGYAILTVQDGDRVEVSFPLAPVVLCANPRVTEDCGKVCVLRGPMVYCAEEVDNGPLLQDLGIDPAAPITAEQATELGGFTRLVAQGQRTDSGSFSDGALYRPYAETRRQSAPITLIPYCLWNNRGEGEMTVWMNRAD